MAASSESSGSSAPETALDLTEQERQQLFDAAARLLRSRGKYVDPRANDPPRTTYYNDKHQEYTPETGELAFTQAEVTREECEAYALPYDKVVIQSHPIADAKEGMTIEVEQMTTGNIPVMKTESIVGVGEQKQWVILTREPSLGIVVEGEGGEVQLRPADDTEQVAEDGQGSSVTLVGAPLFMDEAPVLTRHELIDLSAALESVQP